MSAASKTTPHKPAKPKPASRTQATSAAYKVKRAELAVRLKTLRDESEALSISAGALLARIRA